MRTAEVTSEYFSGPAVIDDEKSTITIKFGQSNFPLNTIFTSEGVSYKFISSSKSLYIDSIIIIKVEKLL